MPLGHGRKDGSEREEERKGPGCHKALRIAQTCAGVAYVANERARRQLRQMLGPIRSPHTQTVNVLPVHFRNWVMKDTPPFPRERVANWPQGPCEHDD